jgi:hypothetical protein
MKLKHHKDLTIQRWRAFPLSKRILMIATELIRARNWIKKKDAEEAKYCYERALELVDLTIDTVKGNLLGELLRWREIFGFYYYKGNYSLRENEKFYKDLVLLDKEAFNLLVKD